MYDFFGIFQGKVENQGSYNDIVESGFDFAGISNETKIEKEENDDMTEQNPNPIAGSASTSSVNGEKNAAKEMQNEPVEENPLTNKLEASSKGKVKGSLVIRYLKSSNQPCTLAFLILAFLLSQFLASVADIWVSYW